MSTATATATANTAKSTGWTKKASANEGGDFELPPGGTYPAVLVGMIDMGTQLTSFNGETKKLPKIVLVWELVSEHNAKGEPFFVAKDFTYSLNAKAKLRAFLEGWLGRKFADDEAIDMTQFVGKDCVLNVTEGTSNAGKRFVDVASATKPMKGLNVPDSSVVPFLWNMDGWDPKNEPPIPDWVPMLYGRRVSDDIKKSDEWGQLVPF